MLVTALLLERKVVLIKNQVGDIALIMQALISLMSPFKWHSTIITYLTEEMVDFLEAPVPFLIGVCSKTWEQIGSIREFPNDIVIFNLESQERKQTHQELPRLPQQFARELLQEFRDIINRRQSRLNQVRQEKQSVSMHIYEEQYWADAQLSVKQLFFNFYLQTLGNYSQFMKWVPAEKLLLG